MGPLDFKFDSALFIDPCKIERLLRELEKKRPYINLSYIPMSFWITAINGDP